MSKRHHEQRRRGEAQEGTASPSPATLDPAGASPDDAFDVEPAELDTPASGGEVPDEEAASAAGGGALLLEGPTDGEASPVDGASPGPEPVNEPEPRHAEVPAALAPAPPKPMADVSPAPVKLAERAPAAVVVGAAAARRPARSGYVFARVIGHGEFRARGYDLAGDERHHWHAGDVGEFQIVDADEGLRLEPA